MSAPVVERFCRLFNELHAGNLERLADVYAPGVVFEDPLHRVEGLEAMTRYFARMYEGVASISFDFHDVLETGDRAMLAWTMRMTHRRLRPGEELVLPGASHVRRPARRDSPLLGNDSFVAQVTRCCHPSELSARHSPYSPAPPWRSDCSPRAARSCALSYCRPRKLAPGN